MRAVLLSGITVFLLTTLTDHAAAQTNSCQSYTNLSDPWRNIGFRSLPGRPMNDLGLTRGWYRFTGIGGDRLVSYCSDNSSNYNLTTLLVSNNSSYSVQSSMAFQLYTCTSVYEGSSVKCNLDQINQTNCGGGVILYYLAPTNKTYATRHSYCDTSACGENAQCGVPFGSCVCNSGLVIPDGIQPQGNSYGCSGLIKQSEECKAALTTTNCVKEFLGQIENLTLMNQVISQSVAILYLNQTQNSVNVLKDNSDENKLKTGNSIVKVTEILLSAIVNTTDTQSSFSISLGTLEVKVFTVGPNTTLSKIPQMTTNGAVLDIDLIGIAKKNNGSASVAFMSYGDMSNILEAKFFKTVNNKVKTMMSSVVSATLPKINSDKLSQAVNFTLIHTDNVLPEATLSCVYWNETGWVTDGCKAIYSNSSCTICSCLHLSTFALIMQTNAPVEDDKLLELLNKVAVSVGLVFFCLALLTFALCGRNPRVNNTARINLCLSLMLAHLLFLLTQELLFYIKPLQACGILAGILHFLFLSAFVWMFIEGVLLFISVRNLSKINSKHKEVLGWKCLIIIGYTIPLVVVGVSAGLFPEGYGSEQCWIKRDRSFVWSFLGPVSFILAVNLILFSIIIFTLRSTLSRLNSEFSQIKHMKTLVFKTLLHAAILGCPWVLGFFTEGSKVLEIVFLFLNSQQGTFIFLIHCVLNQEVRQQYKKRLSALCHFLKPKPHTSEQSSAKSH